MAKPVLTKKQAQEVERKLAQAYHVRDDYPPYELAVWDDRAKYHHYVLKLVRELVEETP